MTAILLSDGTNTIELSADLVWVDELEYDPKTVVRQYAVDGAQHVDVWKAQAGRPITLQPAQESFGDMTRETFIALAEWRDAMPEKTLTLTFPNGDVFSVAFDHPGAIGVAPSSGNTDRQDQEWYRGTLKFYTV